MSTDYRAGNGRAPEHDGNKPGWERVPGRLSGWYYRSNSHHEHDAERRRDERQAEAREAKAKV
jgi:hypothetical protein